MLKHSKHYRERDIYIPYIVCSIRITICRRVSEVLILGIQIDTYTRQILTKGTIYSVLFCRVGEVCVSELASYLIWVGEVVVTKYRSVYKALDHT